MDAPTTDKTHSPEAAYVEQIDMETRIRADERRRWSTQLLLAAAAPHTPMAGSHWPMFCEAWAHCIEANDTPQAICPSTEAQCLAMAQCAAKISADYIDQAAALSPDVTHAMLYSAIASLLRGDLDAHLVRFIQGAKPSAAERRVESARTMAKDLIEGDYTASDAWDFVRVMAHDTSDVGCCTCAKGGE